MTLHGIKEKGPALQPLLNMGMNMPGSSARIHIHFSCASEPQRRCIFKSLVRYRHTQLLVIYICSLAPAGGIITDLVSYYTLPSSVIGNDKYDSLKAAFMYYTVANETPLEDLMQDILVLARDR